MCLCQSCEVMYHCGREKSIKATEMRDILARSRIRKAGLRWICEKKEKESHSHVKIGIPYPGVDIKN